MTQNPLHQLPKTRSSRSTREHHLESERHAVQCTSFPPIPVSSSVYSLRCANIFSLVNESKKFWLHWTSIALRFVSVFICITAPFVYRRIHMTALDSATLSPPMDSNPFSPLDHLYKGLYRFHTISCAFSAGGFFFTGVAGIWSLYYIYFSKQHLDRFVYESVALRVAFVFACVHLGSTLCMSLFLRNVPHDHRGLKTAVQNITLIEILIAGLNGLILFCLPFQWLGNAFKCYTGLTFLRVLAGVFIISLSVFFDLILNTLIAFEDDITSLTIRSLHNNVLWTINPDDSNPRLVLHMKVLKSRIVFSGYISGAVCVLTSLYCLVVSFYRSALLMALDVLVICFVIWMHTSTLFSIGWNWTIVRLLDHYLFEAERYMVLVSMLKKLLVFFAVLDVSIIVILGMSFSSAIAFLMISRFTPLEWTVPQRLVLAHKMA